MIKMPLGGFEILMSDAYHDVDQKMKEEEEKVLVSAPFLWAKSNNLEIIKSNTYIPDSYSNWVYYYTELTPVQETEFILRFL